jgi:SET domain-containing protein
MLLVKTFLKPSAIHGIGLFAAENIPEGTVVWRLDPSIDVELTEEQIERLAATSRDQIVKYTYLDIVRRTYVLCGDDARFFNHEDAPNCVDYPDDCGGTTVAARDIRAGEELTADYGKFDANHRGM